MLAISGHPIVQVVLFGLQQESPLYEELFTLVILVPIHAQPLEVKLTEVQAFISQLKVNMIHFIKVKFNNSIVS